MSEDRHRRQQQALFTLTGAETVETPSPLLPEFPTC
jgi:hypothetical protein